ncbi:MAG: molybdenum cofactor biosynthesis protein MoaE [Dehalococcoidia bacterium]
MIEIRREDFSIDEITEKLKDPEVGALSIYLGTVREFPEGLGLEFENDDYATRKLEEIEKSAINGFDVRDVAIIHREGFLGVSENILLVVVSASHRGPAFDACRSIIDDIKDLHKSWGKDVLK